jgi:hypothetical protein
MPPRVRRIGQKRLCPRVSRAGVERVRIVAKQLPRARFTREGVIQINT